ncbi:MAG TPA: response regulator [Candidatus Eisenbacteria bacterium]|jgi:CheY-like chemotaxis protein
MKRILIIEDDPVTAAVYRQMFERRGYQAETAADGLTGLERLTASKPDGVLLDMMLPGIDGLEVLRRIRATPGLGELPVVAFTNAFLGEMVRESELAGATFTLTKFDHTPWQVVEQVRDIIEGASRPREDAVGVTPEGARASDADPIVLTAGTEEADDADRRFLDAVRTSCLRSAPASLDAMRDLVKAFVTSPQQPDLMQALYGEAHLMAGSAALADLPILSRLAGALEGLAKLLMERSDQVRVPTLRTIDQSLDALELLVSEGGALVGMESVPPRALVVDDDEIALRSIQYALEKAKFEIVTVGDAAAAQRALGEEVFDLVLLDIELPLMKGTELCAHLRTLPGYAHVPVIYITFMSDFEDPSLVDLKGGDDLLVKPFLYMELALKALSLLVKDRLEPSTV